MGEIAHSQVNSCHVAYSVDGNLSRLALSAAQMNTVEGFVDHSKAQLLLPFLNYTIDQQKIQKETGRDETKISTRTQDFDDVMFWRKKRVVFECCIGAKSCCHLMSTGSEPPVMFQQF